ncbi:MAG: carboxypeptidase regulatory-like domain-containing protein [Hydrogenophilales bacterium]|nr:carboxypeptidase regulatory-like domain-containing protein [Hydrogenophilales bacterium]
MRPRAAKSSFVILAACVWLGVGLASAANPAYLGPLNVRLVEQGADGKTTPIKHAPVYLNARNADTDANGTATFDGVPAGRHTLKARLPGYAALERHIDLATGARQPVELTLLKTPGIDWRGTLRDAASGAPIAGAVIGILPIEVPSSLQGPGHAVTDWEGAFEFVDLPPGRYALTATAPGFDVLKGEYRVKPAEEGSRVFDNPTLEGVALDLCLTEGGQCGKPAADAYCQRQGLGASLEHRVKNDTPPTRIIASGKVCDGKHCDRIEWLRCGDLGEADNLRLKPTATPTRLGLKVTDARSQQPLVGARVTLAETWPSGEIASGVTGPGGQIAFANIKNGPANWLDAENKVSLARRRVTARIEADGYAPWVFPASLGEDLTVALNPTAAQAEAEPNDLTAPQDVLTGAPVQFSIENNKDHDTFRFRIAEPARVIVTVGPNNPLETHLRLRDSNAKLLHENGAYRGNDNRIELRLAEGTYYAEISEWGEDASAPGKPLTLNIDATPATDPNEPNGTTQQATPARLAENLSGIVWPGGDRDVYRIEVTRPGILRILEPGMPMERHVRLLDRDGKQLTEQGSYASNAIDFNHQVLPGTHYVELMEWGNDNASLTPYRMRVDFLPDDGIDDPVGATGGIRAVRVLEPGGSVHSTLLPRGDVDLYNIAIPGAGVLRLSSQGRPERHLQLFDRNGKLLTEQGVYANNPADISWSLAGAETLILGIREWGNDSYAASAYALRAWFEPADEIDVMQRNDDFEHATPLAVGDIVHGS